MSKGQNYAQIPFFATPYDVVWASHVLEHMPDVNWMLRKMRSEVEYSGWLAVTVPPAKHNIVGGHTSLWNAGLLLYNLILAGWDCSKAKVKSEGYDISVIVQKNRFRACSLAAELKRVKMDAGDIELLARYFPIPVWQGFDGRISEVNW